MANREVELRPFALFAALVPLAAGTGAFAQADPDLRLFRPMPPESTSAPISFRINEVVEPGGSRRQRRAIVAGVDVAPEMTVGFGLFDTMPRAKGSGGPDPRLDGRAKKSRKAAVGLSFRF